MSTSHWFTWINHKLTPRSLMTALLVGKQEHRYKLSSVLYLWGVVCSILMSESAWLANSYQFFSGPNPRLLVLHYFWSHDTQMLKLPWGMKWSKFMYCMCRGALQWTVDNLKSRGCTCVISTWSYLTLQSPLMFVFLHMQISSSAFIVLSIMCTSFMVQYTEYFARCFYAFDISI